MYHHQVYNSNGGLAPKIGLVLGQSWMVISMKKHSPGIPPVQCMLIEKYIIYRGDCYCLHVNLEGMGLVLDQSWMVVLV